MIRRYNNTILSQFFNYNDPKIAEIADNLFEKIRQVGELAGYIKRDKRTREKFNVIDGSSSAPISVKNDKFTFGYAYKGDLLTVTDGRYDNLGRIYTVEFELLFNEPIFGDIGMFDSILQILPDGSVDFYDLSFSTSFELYTLYRFKLVRDHFDVSLYINDVLIGSGVLSQDIDTEYSILYGAGPSTPPITVYYDVEINSSSPSSGILISVNKIDRDGYSHGITGFTRTYIDGEEVIVTAPLVSNTGTIFKVWSVDSVDQTEGELSVIVTMNQDHILEAKYEEETPITGTITINKVVSNDGSDTHIFTIRVNGVAYTIVQGTPLVISNVPIGNYVITEDSETWYELDSITPSSFSIDEDNLSQEVTVTNIKDEEVPILGSISINKSIGEVNDTTTIFEYTITGTGGSPLIITKSGTLLEHPILFKDLPEDTYTVEETEVSGYTLISITPDTCIVSESGTLDWKVDVVNEVEASAAGGYGMYYNNYATRDSRGLVPLTTRVATDDDWTELTNYLGGLAAAGPKLKTTYEWGSFPGNNSSGFSARPAGYRSFEGVYWGFTNLGFWWTKTEYTYDRSWKRDMSDSFVQVDRAYDSNKLGMSVRFLLDMTFYSQSNPPPSHITDYDGNVYEIIVIGNQHWAKTNLKVLHYRNGDLIPNVSDNSTWAHLSSGACCYPNGNSDNV